MSLIKDLIDCLEQTGQPDEDSLAFLISDGEGHPLVADEKQGKGSGD